MGLHSTQTDPQIHRIPAFLETLGRSGNNWKQSVAGKQSGGGEYGHAHSPKSLCHHPSQPPPLLSSGALLCSYNQCFCTGVGVLPRGHVAMSGDSLGCHRRRYWVESKDAAEASDRAQDGMMGEAETTGPRLQGGDAAAAGTHYSLGQSHFNLLPDLLPFLVSPPGEDVPVLQLLLAGPVPQFHCQELLLASPWQCP